MRCGCRAAPEPHARNFIAGTRSEGIEKPVKVPEVLIGAYTSRNDVKVLWKRQVGRGR